MRTRVKICCISSPAEAALAVRLGADALGLVGAMPSGPGPIPDALITEIAAVVPPPVATFLLTSETHADAIADHAAAAGTSAVQIVSHIEPAQSAALRADLARRNSSLRVVQVIHVEGHEALELVEAYAPHVHAFLLDSGRPSALVPELGGTGRVHDWIVSAAFVKASPRPVFLAGGLNPGNIAEAIRAVRPYGVDICSGVRTGAPLDEAKLAAFMGAVRVAEAAGKT